MPLYKYLPSEFVKGFLTKGEVLFRTLSYFRRVEHRARGDAAEGVHIDDPDNPVKLENLTTGITHIGDYRFLNSVDQENVYAFCCSQSYDQNLMAEFSCNACVVITDPEVFFLRCRVAAKRVVSVSPPGLIHGPVRYWRRNEESPLNVKDPRNIPFLKNHSFAAQDEYRAVFATHHGLKLTQRIVMPAFTFREEIEQAKDFSRLLRLGNLANVAEVFKMS